MAVTIDTYRTIKTLTADETFSKVQAERLLDVLTDSNELLATKADIQALETRIDGVRGEVESVRGEVKSVQGEIHMLRTDMNCFMTSTPAVFTYIAPAQSLVSFQVRKQRAKRRGGRKMEAEWVADRSFLQQLLEKHPEWTNHELANVLCRSVTWVKKWKKRLAEGEAEDESILFSQSRARIHPPEKISEPVVEAILEIRDHPPDELQRTPGPVSIIYYLQQNQELVAAGHRIPTSSRTVWRILDENQRIVRPPVVEHEPLERLAPYEEWQVDFKDVTTATTEDEKRAHQVETFDVVDAGTSILVANPARSDFNASTVIETLGDIFQEHGVPPKLRFDRDPRFVGGTANQDFPAAFVRFLLCIGVEPIICPPRQPQKNPFVERFHRTYEEECIRTQTPSTLSDTQEANEWFHQHYNFQRPHQGISCGNRPPRVAFPELPSLPSLPATIDPDAWVSHIEGRYYRRRITSNGSLQIGRQTYYIGTDYIGQTVAVMVRPSIKVFDVILKDRVLKSLSIKGLCNQMMSLDKYVEHICQEAQSEYQRYLASKRRYVSAGAM